MSSPFQQKEGHNGWFLPDYVDSSYNITGCLEIGDGQKRRHHVNDSLTVMGGLQVSRRIWIGLDTRPI